MGYPSKNVLHYSYKLIPNNECLYFRGLERDNPISMFLYRKEKLGAEDFFSPVSPARADDLLSTVCRL